MGIKCWNRLIFNAFKSYLHVDYVIKMWPACIISSQLEFTIYLSCCLFPVFHQFSSHNFFFLVCLFFQAGLLPLLNHRDIYPLALSKSDFLMPDFSGNTLNWLNPVSVQRMFQTFCMCHFFCTHNMYVIHELVSQTVDRRAVPAIK